LGDIFLTVKPDTDIRSRRPPLSAV